MTALDMPTVTSTAYLQLDLDGQAKTMPFEAAAFRAFRLHNVSPLRQPARYKGMQNKHFRVMSKQTERGLYVESMLERNAARIMELDCSIVSVVSQPCRVIFPDGTFHIPDALVQHDDGTMTVVDVKPDDRFAAAAEVFSATRDLCEAAGIGYAVVGAISLVAEQNVELLLRASRHVDPDDLADEEVVAAATAAAEHNWSFGTLRKQLRNVCKLDASESMLLTQAVVASGLVSIATVEEPLSDATALAAPQETAPWWRNIRHRRYEWDPVRIPEPRAEPEELVAHLDWEDLPKAEQDRITELVPVLEQVDPDMPVSAQVDWLQQRLADRMANANSTTSVRYRQKVCERTAREYLRRFRRHGRLGLVDWRAIRKKQSLQERFPAFYCAVETEFTQPRSKRTGSLLLEAAAAAVTTQADSNSGTASSRVPGRTLQYQILDEVKRRHSNGAHNPANIEAVAESKRAKGVWKSFYFGQVVLIDATKANLPAPDDATDETDGADWHRPGTLVAYDVATGLVVGLRLIETTEAAHELVSLLTDLASSVEADDAKHHLDLLPQDADPTKVTIERTPDGFPIARYEEREYRLFAPVQPQTVVIDGGKAELSRQFERVAYHLGIDINYAPPRTGSAKPHVERLFGSWKTLLEQYHPSFLGARPAERKLEKNVSVIPVNKLDSWYLSFAALVHNRSESTYTRQLPVRLQPTRCRRDVMAATLQKVYGHTEMHLQRADLIDLWDQKTKRLNDEKFQVNGFQYQLSGQLPTLGATYTIATHKDDITVIYVKMDGRWVEAVYRYRHLLCGRPFSERMAKELHSTLEDVESPDPSVAQIAQRALQETMRNQPKPRRTRRTKLYSKTTGLAAKPAAPPSHTLPDEGTYQRYQTARDAHDERQGSDVA